MLPIIKCLENSSIVTNISQAMFCCCFFFNIGKKKKDNWNYKFWLVLERFLTKLILSGVRRIILWSMSHQCWGLVIIYKNFFQKFFFQVFFYMLFLVVAKVALEDQLWHSVSNRLEMRLLI